MPKSKLITTFTSLAVISATLFSAHSIAHDTGDNRPDHPQHERLTLLERLDANDDSVLSLDEFSDRNADKAVRHFNKKDGDGDALLSMEEFASERKHRGRHNFDELDTSALTACVEDSLGYTLPERPDPDSVFVEADTSSDGYIDLDEFLAAGDLKAEQRFATIDVNGDSQLDNAEIDAYQTSRKAQRDTLRSCVKEQKDEEDLLS